MDNNRGSGVDSSNQSTPEQYQENQVVWAKINGYPWWPAYIGAYHQQDQGMIYTVYFFGDNSHSRITFQKIRKFQPNYRFFASLAKKNYKLKLALKSVYQQLNDNKQDVSFFNLEKHNKTQKPSKNILNDNKYISSNEKQEIFDGNQLKNAQQNINNRQIQFKMKQQNIFMPEQSILSKQNRKKPGRPRKIKYNNNLQRQIILQKSKSSKVPIFQQQLQQIQYQVIKKQSIINDNNNIPLEKEYYINDDIMINQDNAQVTKKVIQQKDTLITSSTLQHIVKFQKIKKQIMTASKKQLFNVLINLDLNNQLLFKLLEYNILSKVEEKINTRQYMRLKEKLQKMLMNIYFNYDHHHFESAKRQFIRIKVKKKIYKAIKMSRDRNQDKIKVIDLQGKMWLRFKTNKQLYMKSVVQCLNRLKVCQQDIQVIDINQLIQELKINQNMGQNLNDH